MSTRPEFGVSSSKSKYSRGQGKRLGSTRANSSLQKYGLPSSTTSDPTHVDQRFEDTLIKDELDGRFGFDKYEEGPERLGWLLNMHATIVKDEEWPTGRAACNYYFLTENGEMFRTTLLYSPYFYIGCKPGTESEVEDYLTRRFESVIERIKRVVKEDLKQPNHLTGQTRTYLQLSFRNVSDLLAVRKVLLPTAKKNEHKVSTMDTYAEVVNEANNIRYDADLPSSRNHQDTLKYVIDIREYDVPYYVRVAIDLDIRVGMWYTAKAMPNGTVTLTRRTDLVHRPEPVVLAFDIETTKLPLKFPDASYDSIMMISYMIDGRGYLITNREIVSQDIEDFDYTPKPEFDGPFTIFNEANEHAVLTRFFEHIQEAKPTVFVTYNGDFFDWPFVEARAKANGINMYQEIGVYKDEEDEYKCKHASHMDAFRWVKRDSYLPQGSQGLKAVTTAKLGYNPMEIDPEDMTRFASERPQTLAEYSVSDAVATYYLYMKYVHPFIFSLCNIIPLVPDEVLRKGSGTLCELLLMVEAFKANVIMPNKHVDETNKLFEGHLLESETYVGGHVEALEAGVFRSDITTDFKIEPEAAQQLIDQLDAALTFTIEVEEKSNVDDITNYAQVRADIQRQLEDLRDNPVRHEEPLIYHLDVAAMYPNIILTNRLQPDALIDESMCANCEFNLPDKTCDRRMTWSWRGEYYPARLSEYKMIQNQLTIETFPPKYPQGAPRQWHALSNAEQSALITKRLTDYCRKVYKKVRETKTIERESIICQRENPFYIETVRAFRDRRYEYKGLHKTWKRNLENAQEEGMATKIVEAKNMIVLYDSLQLAHKCILNSFYGYVMRKGARWHSLEMAGIVCLTGSRIIQMARQLVERIGRPLELDTDGIWCVLPKTFPENFVLETKSGKKLRIAYPCTMLNHLVHAKFTNHQYQTLQDKATYSYSVHSENSIFFEIDGPYRAMILPSSTQEDKLLKKRYAVFNDDGSLAELKGFEVKRRGELKLIKIFQSQIFKVFLDGTTLEECYASVAKIANQWLDILFSKGVELQDEELFDLISENRSMSKTLEEYGGQKSTSISTAKRLAEFLGDKMVKDKGLACKFIISARPYDLPVSERAVPVAIFSAEPSVKKHYLRKWLRDDSLINFDIRNILDWPYYLERFGSVIQKLITIPAAMQKVRNPVPRVKHPDWLFKRLAVKDDKFRQRRITDMFSVAERTDTPDAMDADMADIEELNVGEKNGTMGVTTARVVKRKQTKDMDIDDPMDELPDEMPDMHTDYPGWLAYQKTKWKRQRLARIKRRETEGDQPRMLGDVGGYFRQQVGSLVASRWDVLQIAETDIPGDFKMWVMIQRQLYSIRLAIPRIFYLNSRDERPNLVGESLGLTMEACVRTLPRSRPCLHLFRMGMPEATFQAEQNKFSSLFNHPSTEGVYETQIPLAIRALLELGLSCETNRKKTARHQLDDRFDLSDLVRSGDKAAGSYMEHASLFQYIYLFHAHSDTRHFFTLVGASLPKAQVYVVGTSAKGQQMPNLGRLYHDKKVEAQAKQPSTNFVEYKDDIEFEVHFTSTERDALKSINKALANYHRTKNGPAILAINSPRQSSYLVQHCKTMTEFPHVRMMSHPADNKFETLSWVQPVAKRMVHHYLELGMWLNERIKQARYVNVPFCNIPADDSYIFMADVFLARQLIKNDMILWWSPAPRPDLGGREEDETLSAVNELVNTELSYPGLYMGVSVEIELQNLCLDALMEAPIINELEGTSGLTGFDNVTHTLDEYTNGTVQNMAAFGDGVISSKTFTMLRAIVQQWFNDAIAHDSRLSDMMLDTLHRWLMSTSANMYDPCLYGLIHSMMKKVFLQLVAEFKQLGAKIVFANFHKVILTTTKETKDGAMAYASYLLRTSQKKQVLEVLDLKATDYWDALLWMDEMNYGGIPLDTETDAPVVTMQWNIQDYLARAARDKFEKVIAWFVHQVFSAKRTYPSDIGARQNTENSDPRINHLRDFVRHDVTRKVLKWVEQLKALEDQYGQDGHPDLVFPQLTGSYIQMKSPAQEFIKAVCAVLTLDEQLQDVSWVLKRNALRLLNTQVTEFSDEAQFRNPCEYYKLTEVICSYCNHTTDLDFCRDRDLMPQDDTRTIVWKCHGCHEEYDKSLIEQSMMSLVQQWLTAYQLQDLVCVRCRRVKRENIMSRCDQCGSEYAPVQQRHDVQRRLQVFLNVAKEQQLPLLQAMIEWTLSQL